jgi:hypothetical protein
VRPEKGHLVPEVKVTNEIAYGQVWDKHTHPISITSSKWHTRKTSFALGAQLLDSSPLSHWWLA